MIDYTSKMRHMSETLPLKEYLRFTDLTVEKKNSVYIEKGRIVYYDAMSDVYTGELELCEASRIKVPSMSPLEPFLV